MNKRTFPSFSQWKQLFKITKGKERLALLFFAGLAVVSFAFLTFDFYLANTQVVAGYGGSFREGIVGQPRFINPIYGETNDVDRTLIGLTYSGLMTYDGEGKLVNDLVKNYQISPDGTAYTFQLKDDLYWQDGERLTADDVLYTIQTIQNSDYKSPLRANWLNVDAAKISDSSFVLRLNSPYNAFLETCTVKIIPQHIWSQILPENFALSPYNLQPIGSGPYVLNKLNQNPNGFISDISLNTNLRYHSKAPYLNSMTIRFFADKNDLIKAAKQDQIDGFALSALDNDSALAEKEINQGWFGSGHFTTQSFQMPRYFAVFFNTQKPHLFSETGLTKAISQGTDTPALITAISEQTKQVLTPVSSPLLADYYGFDGAPPALTFDQGKSEELLGKAGYKKDDSGQWHPTNQKKPAFQFKAYLKQGSTGTEVSELQGCLMRLDEQFKNLLIPEKTGVYTKITEDAVTAFQQKYLPEAKATGETGEGTRKKLNEVCFTSQTANTALAFTLTTINQPQLILTANILKEQWQKLGIQVTIKAVDLSALKDIIKTRDYDALLYGQALGSIPDLYPFWHSTQIKDPGLNLSAYQNKNADQLLKDAREAMDSGIQQQKYEQFETALQADAPALFLYNPQYVYWVSKDIKGIETTKIVDPAKRFENITNWYIKTRRAWK